MRKGFSAIGYLFIIGIVIGLAALWAYSSQKASQPSPGNTSRRQIPIPPTITTVAPTAITTVAPITGQSSSGAGRVAGIMGVYPEDFSFIKNWGANTVHVYKYPGSTFQISAVLDSAKKAGLRVFVTQSKVNQLNDAFNLDLLKSDPNRFLPDYQTVAGDPAFLGYWIIDEPCNPKKKSSVQAEDLKDLYTTVKAINARIPLIINFADLSCLEGFVNTSQPGWKLTDVAMFTITEKKLRSKSTYITDQAAIAGRIKAFDPNITILPQVAVLEFKEKGAPMTPASWALSTGLETIKHLNVFDGILYYSYHSYENVNFIGKAIVDVKDDPAYASAFKAVFSEATK